MTKTKLQNKTASVIVLNESQAGILRRLSEVQPDGTYVVTSQLNQTYKEYFCVSNNSNQFTLSSDDLYEWKEILIKQPNGTSGKMFWEGNVERQKNNRAQNPSGTPPSSFLSKVRNKIVRWFHNPKQQDHAKLAAPPIATPGIDPSTTPPAATTGTDASITPPAATPGIDPSTTPAATTITTTTVTPDHAKLAAPPIATPAIDPGTSIPAATDASTTPIATPGIDASEAPPATTITGTPGGAKSVGVGEGHE